ncbi:MAG: phosphate acyltransferase PlsX [Candidatus Desantisbacteria bacterium]
MQIAVDAMGGDYAPAAIVAGVVEAIGELNDVEIILVGKEKIIQEEIKKHKCQHSLIAIENASEIIEMDESPGIALKTKKDSSIMVCARLIKEKKAQAMVSAGNTGAVMGAMLLNMGRLKGILRPAIAAIIPNFSGGVTLLLDVGANVDCKPVSLLQFALMGQVYSQYIFGINNPRIGILSIGEEESKGNELTASAFPLLKASSLNFCGNAEGRDIVNGKFDVIVCDGFVGNVVLKFGENLAEGISNFLRKELTSTFLLKIGAFLSMPAFRKFKKLVDYSEYGGAPLLGANGVSIICHGSSSAKAIKNGIRVAAEFIRHDVNKHIEEKLTVDS